MREWLGWWWTRHPTTPFFADHAGTYGPDRRLAGPHAGRRPDRPHAAHRALPASGFAVWRGRCFAVTPRSIAGRRPTTCSWRRSPGSTAPWRPSSPSRPRHFYNLAATQIRRVLIDLSRRYYGAEGLGSHHDTAARNPDGDTPPKYEQADASGEPCDLAEWTEFHEQVEALPEEEREVFNLVWYEQMTHEQAAEVLGVTARTVRRRWQDARYRL